jgi:hypothetical protein
VLKGHSFVTPALIDSALVQTHVGLGVELGRRWDYGTLSIYSPPMGAQPYSFQFDQSTSVASQYLSLGVAVADRFEIGFDGSYTAQLAGDPNSSLVFGDKSAWTFRPGVRIRILRSPATGTQLGVHVYGDFAGESQTSPVGLLGEIARDAGAIAASPQRMNCLGAGDLSCALANSTFDASGAASTTRTRLSGGATLGLAQTFASIFGFQAALGLEAGHRNVTDAGGTVGFTPVTFHVGAAPSLDFGRAVPIALMAEYLFTVTREAPTTSSDALGVDGTSVTLQHEFVFGAYYTGRADLTVGALFRFTDITSTTSYSDIPSVSGPPVRILAGQVAARYFF